MNHALEIVLIAVGLPVSAVTTIVVTLIWTYHKRKLEEIRQKGQNLMTHEIRDEFAKMRTEIRELRDNTSQYDLSFDNALQHLEKRLEHIEERQHRQATQTYTQQPQQQNINRT